MVNCSFFREIGGECFFAFLSRFLRRFTWINSQGTLPNAPPREEWLSKLFTSENSFSCPMNEHEKHMMVVAVMHVQSCMRALSMVAWAMQLAVYKKGVAIVNEWGYT